MLPMAGSAPEQLILQSPEGGGSGRGVESPKAEGPFEGEGAGCGWKEHLLETASPGWGPTRAPGGPPRHRRRPLYLTPAASPGGHIPPDGGAVTQYRHPRQAPWKPTIPHVLLPGPGLPPSLHSQQPQRPGWQEWREAPRRCWHVKVWSKASLLCPQRAIELVHGAGPWVATGLQTRTRARNPHKERRTGMSQRHTP